MEENTNEFANFDLENIENVNNSVDNDVDNATTNFLNVDNNIETEKEPSAITDEENKLTFIRSLSPEYKAEMIMQVLEANTDRKYYGHEKRIELRKLIRKAKKGKLDKYFK